MQTGRYPASAGRISASRKPSDSKSRWPASKVEIWPVGRLRPNPRNARRHSAEQIEQIRASIAEFGWAMPILTKPDGEIIAGHGRWEAGKLEGFLEVPVIVARGWTDAQCRAYGIADNRLTEQSEWDEALLKLELGELKGAGFTLELTGFAGGDLDRLLIGSLEQEIERAPESRYSEQYGVIVICADEADQRRVYGDLKALGLNCRVVAT